ncbi:MAG: serine hydrolase [Proteobacteria bacterium SG_bin5]|nr:beta-lactamase family protein [Sphingomonas sp.]OQW39668.1 MAG: serine hydrolase [Proteobacteria bacterium SG_bin5]
MLADAPPAPAAIVAFEGERLTRARAWGVADRRTGRATRARDPVRVASISKLAVALGVMRLVEAGKLDLDADVATYLGWRPRNPAFPERAVTLRQLLSHTSGVRDAAGYVLPLDADLEAQMAHPAAWDATHGAGYFAYANLNFALIAAAMEGATGERFDRLMARLVFRPLRIDACFNWTSCSPAKIARAVVLYRANGSVARDDDAGRGCPGTPARDGLCDLARYRLARNGAFFSPQGGMRIDMVALAKLGQALIRPGLLGRASLAAITRPAWRFDGANGETEGGLYCGYGLGVMLLALPGRPAACADDPFGAGRPRIGHAGEAYGLRSGLWVDPATRRGVAFYVTAVADDAPKGRSAFTQAEEAMIAWDAHESSP